MTWYRAGPPQLCQRCHVKFTSNHATACRYHPESFSGEDSQRWTPAGDKPPRVLMAEERNQAAEEHAKLLESVRGREVKRVGGEEEGSMEQGATLKARSRKESRRE